MDHLLLIAGISVAVLIVLLPLALVAGVFLGAWITHRNFAHASPVPSAAGLVKSIIQVVVPGKKKRDPNALNLPRMKS